MHCSSTLQGFSGAARPRIGITLRPNPAANAPIAENIPPVTQSRRDDLGLYVAHILSC